MRHQTASPMIPLFIEWNPSPEFFHIGIFPVRYYSLCMTAGLFSAAIPAWFIFKKRGFLFNDFLSLFYYVFFGGFIGARLGHCLFYEPYYFLAHPWEILLPFTYQDGIFHIRGYEGLASHGGLIGVLVALTLFCYRKQMNMVRLLDDMAIVTPLCAAFIRIGNLMNSEMVGKETSLPWAFRFLRLDTLPRHPSQLYEAAGYLILFCINLLIYRKWGHRLKTGFYFGFNLIGVFLFRFLVEFTKESQAYWENNLPLNMGQMLSIPCILCGLYFIFHYKPRTTLF